MSQTNEILAYMSKKPITPIEALKKFGCLRLAARINDLRDAGHFINTELVKKNGKKFARYSLIKEKSCQ
jgi:hypothetical protein